MKLPQRWLPLTHRVRCACLGFEACCPERAVGQPRAQQRLYTAPGRCGAWVGAHVSSLLWTIESCWLNFKLSRKGTANSPCRAEWSWARLPAPSRMAVGTGGPPAPLSIYQGVCEGLRKNPCPHCPCLHTMHLTSYGGRDLGSCCGPLYSPQSPLAPPSPDHPASLPSGPTATGFSAPPPAECIFNKHISPIYLHCTEAKM